MTPAEIIALAGCSRPEGGRACKICLGAAERHVKAVEEGGMVVVSAEERERAEKAEAITSTLTWLIAAGVQVTIGACDHQGGAELRVAIDLDDEPAWYGDLAESLADAKIYCSAQGVEP